MRLFLIFFISISTVGFSQDDGLVYFAEVEPQFPGGERAMSEWLQRNIKYPIEAYEANEQGMVYVQFIVYKTGELSDFKIIRGVSDSIDAEALRVVKKMPNWIPGTVRGTKVSVRYTLPISFKL